MYDAAPSTWGGSSGAQAATLGEVALGRALGPVCFRTRADCPFPPMLLYEESVRLAMVWVSMLSGPRPGDVLSLQRGHLCAELIKLAFI